MRGGPGQFVNQGNSSNSGSSGMQNMGPSPFAHPRQQNFIRQQIRPNTYQGNQVREFFERMFSYFDCNDLFLKMGTGTSGGMNDGMSSGGQFTNMGGSSAPQQQFSTNYGSQQMGGNNAYMMRAQHQGKFENHAK